MPSTLLAISATSQSQSYKPPDTTPQKYAPMLQPQASRAPQPGIRPPITAAISERAGTFQAGV